MNRRDNKKIKRLISAFLVLVLVYCFILIFKTQFGMNYTNIDRAALPAHVSNLINSNPDKMP